MGPIWGRQDPGVPHVGPMNFVIWGIITVVPAHVFFRPTLVQIMACHLCGSKQFFDSVLIYWLGPWISAKFELNRTFKKKKNDIQKMSFAKCRPFYVVFNELITTVLMCVASCLLCFLDTCVVQRFYVYVFFGFSRLNHSSAPSAAYMRRWTGSTLAQTMNGLSLIRRKAIIWTSVGILLIGPLGTHFSEIWIKIRNFSFKKMYLKCRLGNGGHFLQGEMS